MSGRRISLHLHRLQKKIGYFFQDETLLRRALTHSSFAYESQLEGQADNEVLEFLGDSILGFVLADYLYSHFPGLSEGDLSKLKSAAASTAALYDFAGKIHLDRRILLGKGEEKSGGRKKRTILAGAFEALTAALYLDGGLNAARVFLTDQLDAFFKQVDVSRFFINNYKSALQEHLQREKHPAPVYKTVSVKGPDHDRRFVVEVKSRDERLAKAKGFSKKDAEQKAAQKAIRHLLGRRVKTLTDDTFLLRKKSD
jgi:ribonuclease-3